MSSDDLIRYQTLAELSKSKRSNKETWEMFELEQSLEFERQQEFKKDVETQLKEIYEETKPPGEFDYQMREKQADKAREVGLPPAEQINPDRAVDIRENLNAVRIHAQSLYADAMRRSRVLNDALDRLEAVWHNRTIKSSQWQADAGAADILADLRKEASRAKTHAHYCELSVASVKQTNLNLRWIMEDKYDRDVQPTL